MPYEKFWKLSTAGQADLVWEKLFIENSPISEAWPTPSWRAYRPHPHQTRPSSAPLKKRTTWRTIDPQEKQAGDEGLSVVRGAEARGLHHEMHGTRRRAHHLHDQLALRRPRAAGLGKRLQARFALHLRAAHRPVDPRVAADRAEAQRLGLRRHHRADRQNHQRSPLGLVVPRPD